MGLLNMIAQAGILVFSVTAIILVAEKNKWGFVFGLISQPFWFISACIYKQWGIFFVSIIYTFSWAYGIYAWFFKHEGVDKKKLKKVKKK